MDLFDTLDRAIPAAPVSTHDPLSAGRRALRRRRCAAGLAGAAAVAAIGLGAVTLAGGHTDSVAFQPAASAPSTPSTPAARTQPITSTSMISDPIIGDTVVARDGAIKIAVEQTPLGLAWLTTNASGIDSSDWSPAHPAPATIVDRLERPDGPGTSAFVVSEDGKDLLWVYATDAPGAPGDDQTAYPAGYATAYRTSSPIAGTTFEAWVAQQASK